MIRVAMRGGWLAAMLVPCAMAVAAACDEDGEVVCTRLPEMVVAATRSARPLQTTPAAVSVVDADELDRIQAYAYADVFEAIPGVTMGGGPRRIAEEPSIRGFADEQVVIRIDGARQNFNRAHSGRFLLDPDLLQRIEVVRGNSSAAYGSGALGGVFDLQTKDGRDFTGGVDGLGLRLRAAGQSNGDEASGFATLYGQSGRFDGLASFAYRDLADDLRDGRGEDILASKDRIANGLFKAGFDLDARQRIELAFDTFDNDGRNPSNANDLATASNLVDRETQRRNGRMQYRNHGDGALDLSLNAWRNEIDVEERRLSDGRLDVSEFVTHGVEAFNSSRFADTGYGPLVLTIGGEWYRDAQRGLRNGAARPQFPDAEVDYTAAFAQLELPLPGGFDLVPGLRWDRFDYANDAGLPARDDDRLSPKLALGWSADQRLYLWADWSRGFRAPSLTELFADGVHFVVPLAPGQVVINELVPTPDLAAEKSSQVQVGARWQGDGLLRADDRLRVELAWFHNEVDDFIDQVVTFISGPPTFDPISRTLIFPGTTINENVDATLRGFEASVEYASAGWFAQASLSLLGSRRDGSGDTLASAAPDRLNLRVGRELLDRQLRVGIEAVAADDRRNVPEGALSTPGYGKYDLFLQWQPRHGALAGFRLSAGIDNLFDRAYRLHPNAIDQPGRNWKLSLARQFDL